MANKKAESWSRFKERMDSMPQETAREEAIRIHKERIQADQKRREELEQIAKKVEKPND